MATKDGIKFKKLGDALAAFERGELPKGTKLVIGETSTIITKRTKLTGEVFYKFDGSPAKFAQSLFAKHVGMSTKLKVELDESLTNPMGLAPGDASDE
jgi:hypothetical protein